MPIIMQAPQMENSSPMKGTRTVPGKPSADIAPTPHDNFVNFLDFAVLADNWLAPID